MYDVDTRLETLEIDGCGESSIVLKVNNYTPRRQPPLNDGLTRALHRLRLRSREAYHYAHASIMVVEDKHNGDKSAPHGCTIAAITSVRFHILTILLRLKLNYILLFNIVICFNQASNQILNDSLSQIEKL